MSEIKIGLCGKMRAGKDSVADYLVYHYGFWRFAFGDEIKRLCRRLYPDQMRPGTKNRALLQGVGQALRQFDGDVWVRNLMETIKGFERATTGANIVVTDVRQPNEYKRLKAEGFTIIRVNCPDDVRHQRMIEMGDEFSEEDLTHETEQYVDSFAVDYEIYNGGKLTHTYQQIDYIIDDIRLKRAKRIKQSKAVSH